MDCGGAIRTALDAMGAGADDLSHQADCSTGDRGIGVFTFVNVVAELVVWDMCECLVHVKGFRGLFKFSRRWFLGCIGQLLLDDLERSQEFGS